MKSIWIMGFNTLFEALFAGVGWDSWLNIFEKSKRLDLVFDRTFEHNFIFGGRIFTETFDSIVVYL